jgi:predicted PurR-regulated permease PerM
MTGETMPPQPDRDSTASATVPAPAHDKSVTEPHAGRAEPVAEPDGRGARPTGESSPWGRPGEPVSRRSPFLIGMAAAAGVAVVAGCVELILLASDALVLIGLALFIAIGLEPAVAWLVRHGLRRWAAVTLVSVGSLGLILGFLAAVIPPLVAQGTAFASRAPAYLRALQDHNSVIGKLNERFHLQQSLDQTLNGGTASILNGVLGAGTIVFNALVSTIAVIVLTVYFLASFPQLRNTLYRLVPNSRRPRTVLIGDRIFAQVGAYVIGNVIVSLIAGFLTFVWVLIFGVPYPLLLAIMVALLDLVPVVGSTVAGAIVCLVALTVSVPVTLATAAFFVVYRFLEDYLLFPKIIGRVVDVPSVVTVVAVLLGGMIYGIIGALVAIPIAAATLLVVQELLLPRLDQA